MKKVVIGIVSALLVGGLVAFLIVNNNSKQNSEKETPKTSEKEQEKKEETEYVKVSKNEITVVKGKSTSFVVTFTNPDLSTVREYINCKDSGKMVDISYTDIVEGKTTVEVEGLKVGTTEIEISDYEYPESKAIVKVKVVDKK